MTNYYAGIGSRDTPPHTLKLMEHMASHLGEKGWVLRSGAAQGADTAFETGAIAVGAETEIYTPWPGFNNSKSDLNPDIYPFLDEEIKFAARFHPNWNACSPAAKRLHTRNVRQIIGMEKLHGDVVQPVKFVVCWTKNGQMIGGTSQALRIADELGIKIFNLGSTKNNDELESIVTNIDKYAGTFT